MTLLSCPRLLGELEVVSAARLGDRDRLQPLGSPLCPDPKLIVAGKQTQEGELPPGIRPRRVERLPRAVLEANPGPGHRLRRRVGLIEDDPRDLDLKLRALE